MLRFDSDPPMPPPDTVIWRYMPDNRFTDLLGVFNEWPDWQPPKPGLSQTYFQEPGNLWFSHPYAFDDTREGTLPAISERPLEFVERVIATMRLSPVQAEEFRARFLSSPHDAVRRGIVLLAQLCGVSCWTTVKDDQDMWDLFGGADNGVAIRSTAEDALKALLYAHSSPQAAKPLPCEARYVDHGSYFTLNDGYRGILSLVRGQFSYEREVRFIARSHDVPAIRMKISRQLNEPAPDMEEYKVEFERIAAEASVAVKRRSSTGVKGFHLPINLHRLMHEVMIQPKSQPDYEAKVRDALDAVGLTEVPVTRSSL